MVKQLFDELQKEYSNLNVDYHRKVDTKDQLPVFIGITEDKTPYFSFEIPASLAEDSQFYAIASCSGFKARIEKKTNIYYRWKLLANKKESYDIFFIVIDDLISIANTIDNSQIQMVLDRIILWNQFFKRTDSGVLDYKKQHGLFVELLFLKDCIEKKGKCIVCNWIGPKAKTKDFIFKKNAVEIKSSIKSDTNRIHISDENQLDCSGFDNLFLNYRQIEVDQIDGMSIPELIDCIYDLISNPDEKNEFCQLLMLAGYSDGFRDLYANKYSQIGSYYFAVKEGFPSITPSKIDLGIKRVSYEIEFSLISDYIIEESFVFDTVLN